MRIVICGSLKFYGEMVQIKEAIEKLGHLAETPVKVRGVNYWAEGRSEMVQKKRRAKRNLRLIDEHFRKIGKADAILVVNETKKRIKNYIGANTFAEMVYAHFLKRKIYLLNPIPNQKYILDEIWAINPAVIGRDLRKIPI